MPTPGPGAALAGLYGELSATPHPRDAFSGALRTVRALTGADACAVLELGADGRLNLTARTGISARLSEPAFLATYAPLCESALAHATPLLIGARSTDAVESEAGGALAIALGGAKGPFGVLWACINPPSEFSEEGEQLLACVANMLTDAVERAEHAAGGAEPDVAFLPPAGACDPLACGHVAIARRQALRDSVTGTKNRAGLIAHLDGGAGRPHSARAVLLFGLQEPPTEGLSVRLLLAVSQRLCTLAGDTATVARISDDTFAVVRDDLASPEAAGAEAHRLVNALTAPFRFPDATQVALTVSAGVSLTTSLALSAQELLGEALSAVRATIRSGGGAVEFFDAERCAQERARRTLISELRGALDREEISVAFQPAVNLRTGRIYCFEALARWRHPERGELAPAQFIPLAEDSGLILPLGAFILDRALAQVAAWREQIDPAVKVAVNISARQMTSRDLPTDVEAALAAAGVPPGALGLELTEAAVTDGDRDAERALNTLHGLGVSLLLDDFGTGYSSLAYLRQFPFDVLKLDLVFSGALEDRATAAIARAAVSMAQALDMKVLAEGIETEAQRDWFAELGAGYGQGYLFGRPVAAEQAGALLGGNVRTAATPDRAA